jgi:hypothetical protein
MNTLLRRLRGLLGTALIWAVLWFPIGLVAGLYRFAKLPPPDLLPAPPFSLAFFARYVASITVAWMVWGAICGAVFALLLSILERRRDVDSLSGRRTAIWGALGTMALPAAILAVVLTEAPAFDLITPAFLTLSVSALLGAGCAAATVALGKRATTRLADPDSSRSSLTSA